MCSLLEDNASDSAPPGMLDDLTGESSYLVERLCTQVEKTKQLLDARKPGLFERTWIGELFWKVFVELDEVTEKPHLLPSYLPGIVLDFHKVKLAAHEVLEETHREKLIAAALCNGRQQGIEESKKARSDASRKAVKQRGDQVQKAAFLSWARTALEAGAAPSNIDDVQCLDGFLAEWSQRNLDVLKRWCREAGFSLKGGRPRKKT